MQCQRRHALGDAATARGIGPRERAYVFAGIAAALLISGAQAETAKTQDTPDKATSVIVHANDEMNLKEFSVQTTVLEKLGNTVPTTYDPSPAGTEEFKRKIILFAAWKDNKEFKFELGVQKFSDRDKIEVFFIRRGPIDDYREAAKPCRRIQTKDSAKALFTTFFACKELAQQLFDKSQIETRTYFMAVQGWFNSSYNLSKFFDRANPYLFDEDAMGQMRNILNKYDSGDINPGDVTAVIDVTDIRNKMRNIQVADVYLAKEVMRLVGFGRYNEAKKVNDYLMSIFPSLQKTQGTTVVEGVNMDLLVKNADFLSNKVPPGQI